MSAESCAVLQRRRKLLGMGENLSQLALVTTAVVCDRHSSNGLRRHHGPFHFFKAAVTPAVTPVSLTSSPNPHNPLPSLSRYTAVFTVSPAQTPSLLPLNREPD